MKLPYEKETDSLVIHLRDSPVVESEEIATNAVVDFDAEGEAVSIEVLRASLMIQDADDVVFEGALEVRSGISSRICQSRSDGFLQLDRFALAAAGDC